MTKPPTFERAIARAAAALACSLAYAMAGHAQSFPAKPVLLILPTAPGGPVDIVARIVAPEASKLLGQPIVMENRPGASQKIGIHSMLRARATATPLPRSRPRRQRSTRSSTATSATIL